MDICKLPDEVLSHIFSFMDCTDCLNVDRKFRNVALIYPFKRVIEFMTYPIDFKVGPPWDLIIHRNKISLVELILTQIILELFIKSVKG